VAILIIFGVALILKNFLVKAEIQDFYKIEILYL
jgi:hypothetical protein